MKVEVRQPEAIGEPIIAYTGDMSTGGLSLIGDHGLARGQRVRVALSTPSSWEPIELTAEVCWAKGPGGEHPAAVGLRFVDLSSGDTVALTGFVEALDFDG